MDHWIFSVVFGLLIAVLAFAEQSGSGSGCGPEIDENIHWPASDNNTRTEMPCPGRTPSDGSNAYRNCTWNVKYGMGIWGNTERDACLTPETRTYRSEVDELTTYNEMSGLLDRFRVKILQPSFIQTVSDLSACVDVIEIILKLQQDRISSNIEAGRSERWDANEFSVHLMNATDVRRFVENVIVVIDKLLPEPQTKELWMLTKPSGQLLIRLLNLIRRLADAHADFLLADMGSQRKLPILLNITQITAKMEFSMTIHPAGRLESLHGDPPHAFDHYRQWKRFRSGTGEAQDTVMVAENVNLTSPRAFVVSTAFIPNMSPYLPASNQPDNSPDHQRLNSGLHFIEISPENLVSWHWRDLVNVYRYSKTDNISNSRCFLLNYGQSDSRKLHFLNARFDWTFNQTECFRVHQTVSRAMCACNSTNGLFSGVSSDMFDPYWVEEKSSDAGSAHYSSGSLHLASLFTSWYTRSSHDPGRLMSTINQM